MSVASPKPKTVAEIKADQLRRYRMSAAKLDPPGGTAAKMEATRGWHHQNQKANPPTRDRVSAAIALVRARQAARRKLGDDSLMSPSPLSPKSPSPLAVHPEMYSPRSSPPSSGSGISPPGVSPPDMTLVRKAFAVDARRHQSPLSSPLRAPLTPKTQEQPTSQKKARATLSPKASSPGNASFFSNIFASRANSTGVISSSAMLPTEDDQENSPQDAVTSSVAVKSQVAVAVISPRSAARAVHSPIAAAVISSRSVSRKSAPRLQRSPPSRDRTDSPRINSNDSDEYSVDPETLTDVGRFIDALHGKQQGLRAEPIVSPRHDSQQQQFLPPVSSDSSEETMPLGPETLAGIRQYIDAIAKPKEMSMLAAATYSSDADDLVPLETKAGIGAFIDSLHKKSASPGHTKQTLYVSSSEDSSLDQTHSSDSVCHQNSQNTGEQQLPSSVKEPETDIDNLYEKSSADLEDEVELLLDDALGDSVDTDDCDQPWKEGQYDESRETSSHATGITLNPSDLAGEDFLEADLTTINEEFSASFAERGHVSSDGEEGDEHGCISSDNEVGDDSITSVQSGHLATPPMPESPCDAGDIGDAVQTALSESDPITAIRSGFFESDSNSPSVQDLDTMDINKRIQERIEMEEAEIMDLEGIEVPLTGDSSDRIESAIKAALAGEVEAACTEEKQVVDTTSDDRIDRAMEVTIEAARLEEEKEAFVTNSSNDEREMALAGELEAASTEEAKEVDNEARELIMTFHEGLGASSNEELEKGQLHAPDSPQSQGPLLKVFSAMESIDEDDNIQGFLTKMGAVEDGDIFSKLTPPIGSSEDEIKKLNDMIISVSKQTFDNDDGELDNGGGAFVGAFLSEDNSEMAKEVLITTTSAENYEPSSFESLSEDEKSYLVEELEDDTSTSGEISVETSDSDKPAPKDNLEYDKPPPTDALPVDYHPAHTETLKDGEATLGQTLEDEGATLIIAQTLDDEEPAPAQSLDEEPTLAQTLDEEPILAKSLDEIEICGQSDADFVLAADVQIVDNGDPALAETPAEEQVANVQIVDDGEPALAETPDDEELALAESLDEIQNEAESNSILSTCSVSDVRKSDSALAAISRSLSDEEPEFAESVGIDQRGLAETGNDEEPMLGEPLDKVRNHLDADSVLAACTGSNVSEDDSVLAAGTGSNVSEGDSILGAHASNNASTTSSVEFTVDDFAQASSNVCATSSVELTVDDFAQASSNVSATSSAELTVDAFAQSFAPQRIAASFDDQSEGNDSSEGEAAGELVDDSVDLVDAFLQRLGSHEEDVVAEEVPPAHIPFEPDRDEEENERLRDVIATLEESDGEVFCQILWGAPSAEIKTWKEFIESVAPFLSSESESTPLVAEAQIRSVASRLQFPKAEDVEMIIEQIFGLQSASSGIKGAPSTDTMDLNGVLYDEKFENMEEVDDTENISAFLSRMTALKAGGHFGQVDKNHAEDLAVEVDVDHGFVNRQLQAVLSDDVQWWHEETKMDTLKIDTPEIDVTSPKTNSKKVLRDDELVSSKGKSKKKSESHLSTISPACVESPRSHMDSRVARSRSKDFTPARELKKAPYNQMVRASRSYVHSPPSADIKPSLSLTQIPSSIGDFESMFLERERRIILSNNARNAKWQNPWNKRFAPRHEHRGREEIVPLMSKKPPHLSGVDAAKSLSKWSFRPDQRHKMPLKQHWRSAYKERTKNHCGYFNVDVHSLYETSVVIAKVHHFDEAPWERREVKQRFLHEKSISLSRNWFGSLLRKRGNDRYREPVAHPKSMEMPMENLPDEGEWVDEWYITWQQRQQGYKKQLGRSSESDSDSNRSDDDSDGSETYTNADDGTNTLRDDDTSAYSASAASESVYTSRGRSVYSRRHRNNSNQSLSQFDEEDDDYWEDPPECGTFHNTKQRIGERLSLVHHRHLSSLRQSRWRRKYFPRGTFPYNR